MDRLLGVIQTVRGGVHFAKGIEHERMRKARVHGRGSGVAVAGEADAEHEHAADRDLDEVRAQPQRLADRDGDEDEQAEAPPLERYDGREGHRDRHTGDHRDHPVGHRAQGLRRRAEQQPQQPSVPVSEGGNA